MRETERGQCVLGNLLYDLKNRRIEPTLARQLPSLIADQWERAPDADEPWSVLGRVVEGDRSCRLRCTRRPALGSDLSTVLDARDFADYYLDPTVHGLETAPRGEAWGLLGRLDQLAGQREVVKADAELKGSGEVRWATTRSFLRTARGDHAAQGSAEVARSVRDRLGLVHYGSFTPLIEITYSSAKLAEVAYAAPCVLDGVHGAAYRSHDADDRFGRAVDLRDFEVGGSSGAGDQGGPELVHDKLPFGDGFGWQSLGEVAPAGEFDLGRFAACLAPGPCRGSDHRCCVEQLVGP